MNDSQGHQALAQTAVGIVLSIFICLLLMFFGSRFDAMHSYRNLFFSSWSQLVCCLLAIWAVWLLSSIWRASSKRQRCVCAFRTPEAPSIRAQSEGESLIADFSVLGHRCNDGVIEKQIARLVDLIRSSAEVAILLPSIDAQIVRWAEHQESEFAAVRMFCWTIPVIGLVGTVLALGQAVSGFALFLSAGDHTPEDVRKTLAVAESNLGTASQPLLVAVLLTVVVATLWSFVAQSERRVFRAFDDLCRGVVTALANFRPVVSSAVQAESRVQPSAPDVAIRATLHDLRAEIAALAPGIRRLAEELGENAHESTPYAREASARD